MSAYSQRISAFQDTLAQQGLAGAVLGPSDQMRYLSGWAEPGHERLIGLFVPAQGEAAFLVPAMNAPQAQGNPAGIKTVLGWKDEDQWQGAAKQILADWRIEGRALSVDDELHAIHLLDLQKLTPGSTWVSVAPVLTPLRSVKDCAEQDAMRRSSQLTDRVVDEIAKSLREGDAELEVQARIDAAFRANGTKAEFALVCFGENTALPHHSSGNRPLKRGDVVILDIGCKIDGYASDITRTFAFGPPDPLAHEVYQIVLKAHQAAFQVARPGITGEQIDEAAREVITQAGYGEQFVHRTGHGIGLSTHEPPYIVKGNSVPLAPGNCFTDEPGIYLPGKFGIRIENVVMVTGSGAESFNSPAPSALPIL